MEEVAGMVVLPEVDSEAAAEETGKQARFYESLPTLAPRTSAFTMRRSKEPCLTLIVLVDL